MDVGAPEMGVIATAVATLGSLIRTAGFVRAD
jgi:hypothetical protein